MRKIVNTLLICPLLFQSLCAYSEEEAPSKMAVSVPNAYIASDSEGFSTYK